MTRFALITGISFLVVACGGGGESGGAAAGGAAAAADDGPRGTATITGTIKFSGTPPTNPPIDMAEEAACQAKHPGGVVNEQVVVTNGMLSNAFVYVKAGPPVGASYAAPATPVSIDQDGCVYHPRVFGAMVNQPIEIKNSDPVLHNIKAVPTANRGFNISQPTEGMTTTRTFSTPEVMVPLECNVHGWMNAFVGVVSHPFFAVSGADGSFTISGLPAGTYELEAWHEKLGTRTVSVTVTDGGSATAEITFGPAA